MLFNKKCQFINKIQKLFIIIFFFLIKKSIILKIPSFYKPLVSIIIPVHNNFRYTYNCISSILKMKPIVPYEIIIGNDLSTDNAKIIEQYVKNIIVHNNINKNNYLMSCNEVAKFSRGKYIVFLNNDAKVQKE